MSVKDDITLSIPKEMLETILASAKALHPRETLFLLRGKKTENLMNITELLIPPVSNYGRGFASYPMHMLPMDFSIVGTAHSHPSGNPTPSTGDLNHSLGKVLLIVAFPYLGISDVAVYNRGGEKLSLRVT